MHIEDLHLNRRLFLGGTLTAGALGTTLAAESAAAATGGPRHDQRAGGQSTGVSDEVMRAVYEEVKTPFKYGPVVKTPEGAGNVDSPSVFRYQDHWYMVHLVFRNDGYETLLESSPDLVNWTLEGTILPFRPGAWDAQQAAGYIALQDTRWGGSAELGTYARRYWMSYLGGSDAGYEGGELSIGVASTADPSRPRPWVRLESPVLSPNDPDTRYWERSKLFKSTIIEAPRSMLGSRFVMYYNATGAGGYGNETIGMALSDDMVHWRRYREAPVVLPYEWHGVALIGDPQVVRVGDVWVMFFWNTIDTDPNGRFDSFACSYDLVNWRKWRGQALSSSTRSWDYSQATKPWLIKHDGVVYHFYNAQGEGTQSIGLATSVDLRGESKVGDVAVSASHTFAFDTPTALVDGVTADSPRWTAFNSPNTTDWVQFDFTKRRRLGGLTVHVYDDNGGVQPPRQMYVEYLLKNEWNQATHQRWAPAGPQRGPNRVTFDQITTKSLRVYFIHREGGYQNTGIGTYSGATEVTFHDS